MRKFLGAISIAVIAPSCSALSGDPGAEPAVDLAAQAAAVTPGWVHPACDVAALAPPGGDPQVCNGPWIYEYQDYWQDHQACQDTSTCKTFNTCTSWDVTTAGDGLGAVVPTPLIQVQGPQHTQFCKGGPHPPPCTTRPDTVCPAEAAAKRTQLRPSGIPAAADANYTVSWRVTNLGTVTDPEPPQGGGPHATEMKYRCELDVRNLPQPSSGQRPVCGCAEFVANECEHGGRVVAFSAPGARLPTDAGAPSPGSTRRAIVATPTCTTCDAFAIGDPAGAQAKFACLDQSLDNIGGLWNITVEGPASQTDVMSSIGARMELTLELAADRLTENQRWRAEEIFTEVPDATLACRSPLAWEPSCKAEAAPFGLPGVLQLCQDLVTNPATPRAVASFELSRCLSQLANVKQLPTESCRAATLEVADKTMRALLTRAQPDYTTSNLAAALPTGLGQINDWWGAANVANGGDPAWLRERSSAVSRGLWASLERATLPHAPGSPPGLPPPGLDDAKAAALLADIADNGLTNDVAVLAGLFDDAQTGSSPMLLSLTGDSLRGLEDRLEHLEAIHDVGCRFAPCKAPGGLRSSAVSELVHAFAVLTDAAELQTVLAGATKLQQQQPSLRAALGQVRAHHGRLSDAWNALGRSEPFADLGRVVDPPAEAAQLAKVVRGAALAWASYEATGEFSPGHRPRLTAAALEQGALVEHLGTLIGDLDDAKDTFSSQRLNTVNDVLAQVQNAGTAQSIRDRDDLLRAELKDVVSRALGLEQREASDRAGLAKFQAAFESIAGSLDANAVFHTQSLPHDGGVLRASAADAHHPPAAGLDLARDRFHVETLQAGEALRLHITGSWSPSCAISKATVPDPADGSPVGITVPNPALTGPTGYWAGFENGTFKAHTESADWSQQLEIGASVDVCTGFEVFGSGGNACAYINFAERLSDSVSNSNGRQTRTSASFTSGIRLPSTPLKDAPAGSLVAVLTRAGSPLDVLDVRVVQSQDLILATKAVADGAAGVDVHFVVNDIDAGCAASNDRLQIAMVKTTPFGNVATALGAAMSEALAAIEEQAPAVLAGGQLSPSEANALRSGAWLQLQQSLPAGLGLANLPNELRQFFEAFLDREIASLARRGDIHAANLRRDQILLELAANGDELTFNDERSRLTFLIPRWRLRDLSGVELATTTDDLTRALTAHVAPVFELRNTAGYEALQNSAADQLDALIDLSITTPLEASVDALSAFAKVARGALANAPFELPATARRTVIVAVPRPTTATVPVPQLPPWHKVSDATAKAFWASAVDAAGEPSHSATLKLSPSDLYVFGGDAATLACSNVQSDIAPIVRRAAVYLDTQMFVQNQFGIELPARAAGGADVTFPLVGRTTTLAPDDARGIPLSLPAIFGGAGEALDKFEALGGPGLGAGAGLSPFTSFEFDLTPLGADSAALAWAGTQALYLVFEVERQVSFEPAWVEGVCVQRAPANDGPPSP